MLEHPGARRIGSDEHILLAWMMDNASEVHGNLDRAARGPFGGPLVLGALSVAIVVGLAGPAAPPPDVVRRSVPVGWRRIGLVGAVLPGDTITATSSITEVERDADGAGGTVDRIVVGRTARAEVVRIEERCWAPSRASLGQ